MSRMSKKRKLEWAFFLNHRNRIAYNELCRKCVHGCKQSFRAEVMVCPRYQSKRAKEEKRLREENKRRSNDNVERTLKTNMEVLFGKEKRAKH